MSRLNSLLRVLTLRCEAASELSSRELDDSLPRLDRAALLCHVLACRSCLRFRAQVRLIRKAVRRRRSSSPKRTRPRADSPRKHDTASPSVRRLRMIVDSCGIPWDCRRPVSALGARRGWTRPPPRMRDEGRRRCQSAFSVVQDHHPASILSSRRSCHVQLNHARTRPRDSEGSPAPSRR